MRKKPIEPPRNHGARWTASELRYVEKHYGELTTIEIATKLGRSKNGVRRIVALLGLERTQSVAWTDEEIAILRMHYDRGDGVEYVHSRLPQRSRSAIMAYACKLGLTGRETWSVEEQDFLKKHYGVLPTHKIAAALSRSVGGVRSAVNALGLSKKQTGYWTEKEMAVIRADYDHGAGMDKVLAQLPGRTRGAISVQASKMGLTGQRVWLPEEIRILKRFYPLMGGKVIEKLPNRTLPAIKHQAKHLGLTQRRKPKLPEGER